MPPGRRGPCHDPRSDPVWTPVAGLAAGGLRRIMLGIKLRDGWKERAATLGRPYERAAAASEGDGEGLEAAEDEVR
jgi:hypothetical protein